MVMIRISDAAMNLIHDASIGFFRQEGKRAADGMWEVPIDEDTLERLDYHRMAGETDDDVIIRMFGIRKGLN